MLFKYHAIDQDGHERDGTIDAPSQEVAVAVAIMLVAPCRSRSAIWVCLAA